MKFIRVFRDRIRYFLVFFILFIPLARADRITGTVTSSSARGLAMGEAVINSERRSNSVFYNPANIAVKNTGIWVEAINVKAQSSEGVFTQYGRGSSYQFWNLSKLYDGLKQHPNTRVNGGFSVFPNFTMRNLHLGMLYEIHQGAHVRASDQALEVYARNRFAPVAALSFRLLSGILRVGASVEYVTIGNANRRVAQPVDSGSLTYSSLIDSGSGFRKTAGATLTFPFKYLPSFSVVARDIGNTSFDGTPLVNFGEGRTAWAQPMTVDLATAWTVYLTSRVEFKIEADWRDFVDKSRASRMQRIQIGSELTFSDFLNIRGGYAHGYFSYGMGLTTQTGSLSLAVYTDEMDTRIRTEPDTRYVLQYQFGLFK